MTPMTEIADTFFKKLEAGQGWDACKAYCTSDATFSAQAEPLADMQHLQEYADWLKGLLTFVSNVSYEVKSFARDDERNNVCAYGVFSMTHTGEGGPCPLPARVRRRIMCT